MLPLIVVVEISLQLHRSLIEGQCFAVFRYFLPNALWVVLQGLVSSCFFYETLLLLTLS
jgi:hypothetical protein